MKPCAVVALIIAVGFGNVAVASAQIPCLIGNFSQLPPNTGLALGPTVYSAAITYPDVANAIVAARDAWDVTDAVNRIGDWTGVVTGSDCPTGQDLQIGAFDFTTANCAATNGARFAVGLTDYLATKSISLNLYYMFSTNPQPGQYDIQSILTHEFGHLLGLWHMYQGQCGPIIGPRCSVNPDKETMMQQPYDGEICVRTLTNNDIQNADSVY